MSETGASGGFSASWEQFWNRMACPFNLAIFRILFSFALTKEVGTTMAKSRFAIEGGFHVPYVSFIPPLSESTFNLIMNLQYPLILLLALGLFMRPAVLGLVLIEGYVLFTDYMNFRNHPYFFLLVLFLILLSPADEALSVRAIWRNRRSQGPGGGVARLGPALFGPDRPLTMQRLIQMEYSIAYFYSAVHKTHPTYFRGEVLAFIMGKNLTEGWSGRMFALLLEPDQIGALAIWSRTPSNMIIPAVATVALEYLLPFALWSRRLRPWAMVIGIGFHISIALTMNIRAFSIAMMGGYLLFLEPDTIKRFLRRFGFFRD